MAKFKPNYKLWSAIAVAVLVLLWIGGTYNGLVTKQTKVESSWADVETQYQRRVDLIPNLVSSVQGYAQFEKSTLTELTQLRSQWQSAATPNERVGIGNQLDSAFARLLLVYENYPELRTVETVSNLMVQLEGTENRVAVARRDYNEAVRDYNTAIRSVPTNLIAGIFGFNSRNFFDSDEGAERVPKVDLNI